MTSAESGAPQREARTRSLLEEIDEGFAALDWEYRHVHVNQAACRLAGLTREQILGRTPFELWPALAADPLWSTAVREAMELGKPAVVEYQGPAGSWRELRTYPSSSGVSAYFRDITERKYKELERDELFERLGTSRAMLERSQQLAHLGSWEFDLVTGRLAWSDEVYRIFGLEPQEFGATYEAFLERVHPDDRDAVDAAYSGSLREDRDTYEIEHRVVRKHSGEIRFVHERCDHLRDAAGKIVRSVGMVHDITERKLAEAAVHDSGAHLRLASRAGAVGLYEWNATGDAPYWGSPETYELFGLDPDGPVSFERWLDCVHPDDRERLARTMAELRQFGASQPLPSVRRDQYRVLQRDGRVVWLEAVNTVDREGEDIVIRGGVRDITDRKLAEEALRESHRRAELLAWTASSLLSTDDPWGLVEELCCKVMAELDCQVFTNYLVDEGHGRLHLNACAGISANEAKRIEWLDCDLTAGACEVKKGLLAAKGVTACARHLLMVQEEVLGTLSFGTTTRPHFSDDDLALMKAVADHVAMAVHHWRAENERRRYELLATENSRDIMLFMDREGPRLLDANLAAEQGLWLLADRAPWR